MVEGLGVGYVKGRCPNVFLLLFQGCGLVDRIRSAGCIERIATKLERERERKRKST